LVINSVALITLQVLLLLCIVISLLIKLLDDIDSYLMRDNHVIYAIDIIRSQIDIMITFLQSSSLKFC